MENDLMMVHNLQSITSSPSAPPPWIRYGRMSWTTYTRHRTITGTGSVGAVRVSEKSYDVRIYLSLLRRESVPGEVKCLMVQYSTVHLKRGEVRML